MARKLRRGISLAASLVTLAQEKGGMLWKAGGMAARGGLLVLTGTSEKTRIAITYVVEKGKPLAFQPDQDQARPARRTSLRHGRSTLIWINDASAQRQTASRLHLGARAGVTLAYSSRSKSQERAYEHTFHNLQ